MPSAEPELIGAPFSWGCFPPMSRIPGRPGMFQHPSSKEPTSETNQRNPGPLRRGPALGPVDPPGSPSVQVSPPGMLLLSRQHCFWSSNTWPPISSPSRPFHSMVKIQPLPSPVTAHPGHLRLRSHSWRLPCTLQPRQRPHPLKPPATAPRPQRARVTSSVASTLWL